MRKLLLLCLLASPIISFSQDKEAVLEIMQDQIRFWNHGDLDQFMTTYWNSDSLMFIGSNGINRGYKEALEHYKQAYTDTVKMGKLAFEILDMKKLSPEYYFVTGKFFLKRSVGDLHGIFTLLFRKIQGRWLIVVDHTS